MDGELTLDDVGRALGGDERVLRRMVDGLTPVIQARVARSLLRWRVGISSGRSIRQEVEDLVQEIFLILFAEDGKVLRDWKPERGLSLLNFVGLVAERQTISVLRSGKRSPWKEDPTLTEELDGASPETDPEGAAASREELRLLLRHLTAELSPLGRRLFDLLFLRQLTVKEVVRKTALSADAVYQWRSRLRRLAHKLHRELSEEAPGRRKNSMDGRV